MTRSRFLVVLHSLLLACLAANLAVSLAAVDRWRSLVLLAAFVCAVAVRDDLTRTTP